MKYSREFRKKSFFSITYGNFSLMEQIYACISQTRNFCLFNSPRPRTDKILPTKDDSLVEPMQSQTVLSISESLKHSTFFFKY